MEDMIEFTSKQRKALEKLAHDLQPVVIVGGAGVTAHKSSLNTHNTIAHFSINFCLRSLSKSKTESHVIINSHVGIKQETKNRVNSNIYTNDCR